MKKEEVIAILEAPRKKEAIAEILNEELELAYEMAAAPGHVGRETRINGEAHVLERVTSSPSIMDHMAEKTVDVIALEEDLQNAKKEIVEAKRAAFKLLQKLENLDQMRVMYYHFVRGLSFRKIEEKTERKGRMFICKTTAGKLIKEAFCYFEKMEE